MERIELAMAPAGLAGAASKLLGGTGAIFRYMPPDMNADWHTAPRRQMVATISGEGEIETGDGQVLVVRPGVVTLLEDLTGKGHLTRGRGATGRLSIFLPLNDETTIP
jgi:quercetin dioxygenase-like cupin family protein